MQVDPVAARAELCRRSFYRFFKEFWPIIVAEDLCDNWHIEYLCNELQYLNSFVEARKPKPYDLVINIPPGTTKSTIVSQMYNAWCWTRDPSQRFLTSSHSHSLALSHSIKTRDVVTSAKYKKLFPYVSVKADQSGKSDFRTDQGGQRYTTSTGGAPTGQHAHQIIMDDSLDPRGAASQAEREQFSTHYQSISSRKVDKAITPVILVMQRLHELDPTGLILAKGKNVKHICLPAELSDNVKPAQLKDMYVDGMLDPVRLNRDVLNEAKQDLGSYGYANQFEQLGAPKEGGMLKREWFPIVAWKPEYANLTWNVLADTAYSENKKNDPTAMICWAKAATNKILIRDAVLTWSEFPEMCAELKNFFAKNGCNPRRSIVEVEPKASGKSLVQVLKKDWPANVKEWKPVYKQDLRLSKEARTDLNSNFFKAENVQIVEGSWNETFIGQLESFPNASHDDFVDLINMLPTDRVVRKKAPRAL